MSTLIVLFKNILRYDGLIFIVGILNLTLYFRTKSKTLDIYNTLHPKKNIPLITVLETHISGISDEVNLDQEIDLYKLDSLFEKENVVNKNYSIFISLTSIFPLMGIAGTVLALLSIQNLGSDLIKSNFLSALTSTFWGVLWGGTCKVFEGFIEPSISKNNEELLTVRNILKNKKVGESFE